MKRRFSPGQGLSARRMGGAIVALAMAVTLLTGSALAAEAAVSPTTGLPTDKPYRPVLVTINNDTNARPIWGLSEADIVYEGVIWGPGFTRFLALYNDNHPEKVGSLRGARTYQAEIREAWDCPFVSWGGQALRGTNIYDVLPPEMHYDGTEQSRTHAAALRVVFGRSDERPIPHNAIANLALMVQDYWPIDAQTGEPFEPRLPDWKFSLTPSAGQDSALWLEIEYGEPDYQVAYAYNAKDRVYERRNGREVQIDGVTGEPIVAANVIVQYCRLTYFAGNPMRPLIATTGGGVIEAFIGGRVTHGTWQRDALSDQTLFLDENGEQLILLPGKTFIQLVPPERSVTYWNAEGAEIR